MTAASKVLDSAGVEGLRLGSFGNCLVTVWSGEAVRATIDAINDCSAKLLTRWPDGITLLVVIEQGCPMPNSEQRRDLDQYYVNMGSHLRAVAQVVEGGNVWAVMARSVFTAVRLVQKTAYPMKVFASAAEGAEWLADHVTTGEGAGPGQVRAGLLNCVGMLRGPAE